MALFGRKAPGLLLRQSLLALLAWWLGTAIALAAPTVPPLAPDPVQDVSSDPLSPTERVQLAEVLDQHSGPEQYKVLIIDSSAPQRLEDYLDAVWTEWQLPENTVLLVVARNQGNALRFYLGPQLGRYGLTVDSAVSAVRQHYAPALRRGGLVEGLSALVAELHRQVLAGGEGSVPEEAAKPETRDTEPHGALQGWGLPRMTLPELPLPRLPLPQLAWPRLDWRDPRLPLWLGAAGLACLGYGAVRYAIALRRWQQ